MAGWRARCRTRPAPPGGSPPVSRARGRAWPAQPGGSRPTDRGARCGGWTGRACRGPASRPGSAAGRAWDQGGNRARVLRLYWRGEEFAPVFEPAAERVTRLPERAPLGEGPPPVAAWWQALRDFRLVQAEIDGLLAGLDDPAVRAGIGEQARQLTDLGENFAATEPGPTDEATPFLQLLRDVVTRLGGLRDELAGMTAAVPQPGLARLPVFSGTVYRGHDLGPDGLETYTDALASGMPITGPDVTVAARSRAYADGYDVVLVIDSVDGRSLAGLRAGVGPEVPDVVFFADARFRVTDVTEAAEGSPAVVSLTELRLAPAGMAGAPGAGLFLGGPDLRQP